MKKIVSILAIITIVAAILCSCGENVTGPDSEYVKGKGTLVVGVTDFAPMDYEKDGKWIGFDADMAMEFAKYLGVEAQIVEIEWDSKEMELNNKNIDCVWNGMTLDDEVLAAMECSMPYCNNAQVVVVKADKAASIKSVEDCKVLSKVLTFAVESGSAGEDMAKENGFNYTPVKDQASALLEVSSGTSDAAIIDSLMAGAMIGENTGYSDLAYTIPLNSEKYGVGFRKGSDLAKMLDAFFAESMANGTTERIAEVYGVQAAIIK